MEIRKAEIENKLSKIQPVLDAAREAMRHIRSDKQVDIGKDLEALPLSALLASGFVTYLAPFPEDVRKEMLQDWSNQIGCKEYSVSCKSELLVLKGEGLPADELSIEELANSSGSILENKTLLDSLNETKTKSNIIPESLKESKGQRTKLLSKDCLKWKYLLHHF